MTPWQPNPESIRRHHEDAGIPARLVLIAVVGFLLVVLASLLIVEQVDTLLSRHQQVTAAPSREANPMKRGAPLQPDQRRRKDEYLAEQQRLLSTFGWVDRQQGIARIPIEDAMRIYVENHEGRE